MFGQEKCGKCGKFLSDDDVNKASQGLWSPVIQLSHDNALWQDVWYEHKLCDDIIRISGFERAKIKAKVRSCWVDLQLHILLKN